MKICCRQSRPKQPPRMNLCPRGAREVGRTEQSEPASRFFLRSLRDIDPGIMQEDQSLIERRPTRCDTMIVHSSRVTIDEASIINDVSCRADVLLTS